MRPDIAFVYVRELLTTITGVRPEQDSDGDLPVRFNGAQFFVRIVGTTNPWVQVFSVAVTGLDPSPELFQELNDINAKMRFARAFFVNGQVPIESEIWADDVNPSNFHHACANIADATDAFTLSSPPTAAAPCSTTPRTTTTVPPRSPWASRPAPSYSRTRMAHVGARRQRTPPGPARRPLGNRRPRTART